MLEAVRVPQSLDDSCSAKRMASGGNLIRVESICPLRPVYAIETTGSPPDVAFTPHTLFRNILPVSLTYLT
jgi:hypothetical protein